MAASATGTTRLVPDAASLVKYLEEVKDKSPVVIDVRSADEIAASGNLAADGRIPPTVVGFGRGC